MRSVDLVAKLPTTSHQGRVRHVMSAFTFGRTGAAVLSVGLLTTVFTAAEAAPAAISASIVEMISVCPAGQLPKTVYSHETFETSLPNGDESFGFGRVVGTGAPEGTHWASSSTVADPTLPLEHHAFLDALITGFGPQIGKVYLSFSYRGVFDAGSANALLLIDSSWDLAPTPDWTKVTLDITSDATKPSDGTFEVGFEHRADPTTAGSFDVDDVSVYSCATPTSGVRGDWTGQGTVDLMSTRSDGTLWVYEGRGDGTVRSGAKVGSGWAAFSWQGSPGDVNGDRLTDLLARRSDGTMWFYPGKSLGTLGSGIKVGTSWNAMTAIATPGDFDFDGRPDLVARRSDGSLHLYRVLATGGLAHLRAIGSGWNNMTSIIGMGDLNGDKRGDIVAVHRDGTLFSYLASGTRLTSAKQVGSGWQAMTWLTSPGDMNKDGRGDLIARRSNGTLWFYAGRSGGGLVSGRQVGSGWNSMLRVL